jgi:hypothetical protein
VRGLGNRPSPSNAKARSGHRVTTIRQVTRDEPVVAAVDSPPTKTCERCCVVYDRPENLSEATWAARRYCGVGCSSQVKRTPRRSPLHDHREEVAALLEQGASYDEIAQRFDVHVQTVDRAAKTWGIAPTKRHSPTRQRKHPLVGALITTPNGVTGQIRSYQDGEVAVSFENGRQCRLALHG